MDNKRHIFCIVPACVSVRHHWGESDSFHKCLVKTTSGTQLKHFQPDYYSIHPHRAENEELIKAMALAGLLVSLIWPLGHKHDSPWMSGRQEPRCCWTGSWHLKDMWADNFIILADSTSFIVGGGKMGVCYCAGQIRKNKSPAPSPPVAPRRMQQSCSSMTCHKHEGKHTRSNTLRRGRRRFYCLREFTQ